MLLVNYGAHIDYRSADGLTALHKATVHDRTDCITVSKSKHIIFITAFNFSESDDLFNFF